MAVLDADVLIPILSCDFLLTSFDLGLYEPVVSHEVLAEIRRNLTADFPQLDPASLHRRADQLRDTLEDHLIDTDLLEDVPNSINPKDRHVIAAALAAGASLVVTNDKQLRLEIGGADIGLVAMSGDEFASHLWLLTPDEVSQVINALVAKRTKQPITADELIEALRSVFPTMATALLASRT